METLKIPNYIPRIADKTIAENLLTMMRPDGKYTQLEARLLDLALVLHAEHGGGNNSAFTVRVLSSTGTDTYSAISASVGSLKGPKHGGANHKMLLQMEEIKKNVHNWEDETEVMNYLKKILNKEAFDGKKGSHLRRRSRCLYSV